MTPNKLQREICREIAKDLGANTDEVQAVVRSQFEYVAYAMEHSGFETVMLPFFGKFKPNIRKIKYLNNRNNEAI